MKKIVGIILFILFVMFPLCAQHAQFLPKEHKQSTGDWLRWSVSADSGMFFGMLYEYVFIARDSDGQYNDTLSRLDWQLNPLVYCGFSLDAELFHNFTLGLGTWLGLPALLGYMEDRDWDANNGDYISFSHHDNFLINAVFVDFNIGYNVINTDSFVLVPLLGFNYKHFRMAGRDGYQEQPPGSVPNTLSGVLITYEQNYYIPYVGVKTFWSPVQLLSLQFFACYSPMVFGFNIDNHLHPSVRADYIDVPLWGNYLSVDIVVYLNLMNDWSLKLHAGYMYITKFKGDIYARLIYLGSNDYVQSSSSRGGASLQLLNVSLGVVFDIL